MKKIVIIGFRMVLLLEQEKHARNLPLAINESFRHVSVFVLWCSFLLFCSQSCIFYEPHSNIELRQAYRTITTCKMKHRDKETNIKQNKKKIQNNKIFVAMCTWLNRVENEIMNRMFVRKPHIFSFTESACAIFWLYLLLFRLFMYAPNLAWRS